MKWIIEYRSPIGQQMVIGPFESPNAAAAWGKNRLSYSGWVIAPLRDPQSTDWDVVLAR